MLSRLKKIGVAVIGCGRISTAHLESIKKLTDKVELIAVVDVNEEVAKEKAEKYGAKKYHTLPTNAFKDPEIEAVVLCVPNNLHCAIGVEAMTLGKHILVEKPLALTLKEADKMINVAKKNKVALMVAQSRRFYKAVFESKHHIEKIGAPFNVITTWNVFIPKASTLWWKDAKTVGEGFIIDLNGPHLVDYILWILEKKPIQVFALGYRNNSEYIGPDEAVINIKFSGGEIATAHLSFNTSPEINEKIIIGPKGTMRIINDSEIWINGNLLSKFEENMDYLKGGGNFERQIIEFVDAINYNREPLTSAERCREVVAVVEAARKSFIQSKPVNLDSFI